MADLQRVEKYLWDISNVWHKYGFNVSQYTGCSLYVMCLKKMIEENACEDPQYMGRIVELTKILYRPTNSDDIEVLRAGSEIVEKTYGIKEGLLAEVLAPFRSQEEIWKKAFIEAITITSDIVVDEDGYYPYVKALVYGSTAQGKVGSENVSSNAVADLLSLAANVKDGNRVLDGTVGYGYSAVKCMEGAKDISFTGVDISTYSIATAALYLVLSGVKDFELLNEDFTAMNAPVDMDRIVMDIPFGMKMGELMGYQLHRVNRWMDTDTCKESEALFIASALDSLSEDGRLVVIVPPNFLFKQTKALATFRRNLVKEGMLKAVVNLPSVYNSTSIKTVMLVFERGNEDVLFVEANDLISRERRNDAVISEENKALLQDILENKIAVDNISFLVPNSKVLEVGDWSIAKYQDNESAFESRSINEINAELEAHYKRLDELNTQSKSMKLFN